MANTKPLAVLINIPYCLAVLISSILSVYTPLAMSSSDPCLTLVRDETLIEILRTQPRLAPLFSVIRNITSKMHPQTYQPEFLSDGPFQSDAEVRQFIQAIDDDNSPSRQALRAYREGKEPWSLYLGPYERILPFISAYTRFLINGAALLPKVGNIAVLGTGPGNDSAVILLQEPDRHVIAYELDSKGIEITQAKLPALVKVGAIRPGSFEIRQQNLMDLRVIEQWDAAFMSNVLYILPDQKHALELIFKALKKGGKVVIHNPIPWAVTPENKRAFMQNSLWSSYRNQAPASQADFAIVASTNYDTLMSVAERFARPEVLTQMMKDVGFLVEEQEIVSYFGSSRIYQGIKP